MVEGTYAQNNPDEPISDATSWQSSSTVFPTDLKPSDILTDTEESPAVEEQIYTNKPNSEYEIIEDGNESSSSSGYKKIIKLGIGLFVALTILLVVFTLIFSRITSDSDKNVVLSYWGLGIDEAIMKPVLEDFEKENPHIAIEYKKQDFVDYKERLNVRTQNGNGPDIFRYHNTWYEEISDILLPLPKQTIEKDDFEDKFYFVTKEDLIKNGAIYGIPLQTDTLALYVNTKLFDEESNATSLKIEYPKSWQEFIDTSTQLTKKDEEGRIVQSGAAIGTFNNVNHAPDILSSLFVQNGVDLDDPGASKDKMADAIRFYTTFAIGSNSVWDNTQDNSLLAFSQGKVAMYFGYSQDYFLIKAQNPDISMKIVPIPQLISDDKINIASYWVEGVSSESKYPKQASVFMEYLARPQTQEKIYAEQAKIRAYGDPYSNKNLADKLKDSEAFVFVDQSNTAVSTPFTDHSNDEGLGSNLNSYLKEAVNSILSGNSEQSGTEKFLQGYDKALLDLKGAIAP